MRGKQNARNYDMQNYAISVRFDGSAYHGWQSQKNAVTIQDTLSNAIEATTGRYPLPELAGCGRTDAGVHALEYIASFYSDMRIPVNRLPAAMRPHLPPDISVTGASKVDSSFHSRFSCVKKEYTYNIYRSRFPDPFMKGRAAFHPFSLNVNKMRDAAIMLVGTHDFSAFRATGGHNKSAVRTIYSCSVDGGENAVEVSVCADGFLYNMVRIIAGTLLYVSEGKLHIDDIPNIIKSRDRKLAGVTLPPDGLYFKRAWYGEKPGLAGI